MVHKHLLRNSSTMPSVQLNCTFHFERSYCTRYVRLHVFRVCLYISLHISHQNYCVKAVNMRLWANDTFFIFENTCLLIDVPTRTDCLCHISQACNKTFVCILCILTQQSSLHYSRCVFISWLHRNIQYRRGLTKHSPPSIGAFIALGHLWWCTFHTHTLNLIFLARLTCYIE